MSFPKDGELPRPEDESKGETKSPNSPDGLEPWDMDEVSRLLEGYEDAPGADGFASAAWPGELDPDDPMDVQAWRNAMLEELHASLHIITTIPDYDPEDVGEPPDLFTFYQELAMLRRTLGALLTDQQRTAEQGRKLAQELRQAARQRADTELKLEIAHLAVEVDKAGLTKIAARMRELSKLRS
jgi:hypothetical protein